MMINAIDMFIEMFIEHRKERKVKMMKCGCNTLVSWLMQSRTPYHSNPLRSLRKSMDVRTQSLCENVHIND